MRINISYDSSAANAPAGFKAAVECVVGVPDAAFTDQQYLG